MGQRYNITYTEDNCLEISKANSTVLVYRIPYSNFKERQKIIEILNRFIVYILVGKSEQGETTIYVGKSKNGLDNRPTSHEDKNINWDTCYILTNFKERTFLNDGTIQFLEDCVQKRINETQRFLNTTKNTSTDTANSAEEETCRDYLQEAYLMLNAIGLDLITIPTKEVPVVQERDYNLTPVAKNLYHRIIQLSKQVNQEIVRNFNKFYINFKLDNRILFSVVPQKNDLKVYLNPVISAFSTQDDLKDVSSIGHYSSGKTLFEVDSEDKFPRLKELVNEIINL